MSIFAGPHCQDEMDRKCEIETYYYPEKSNTSVDQHIPVSIINSKKKKNNMHKLLEVKILFWPPADTGLGQPQV